MPRGVGEFDLLGAAITEPLAVLFALLTQLGDVWFLSVLLAAVYWVQSGRREDVAVIAGTMLTGFAVVRWLKRVFALSRPDAPLVAVESLPSLLRPLYEATGTATGYGFPSGHAFLTTVVYLSLVGVIPISTRRRRLGGAIALVALVSFSRIALGVHYLVDVVAGVGFGLLFLVLAGGLVSYPATGRGTTAFGLAVVVAGLNLLASDLVPDAVLLFGATLGAFGGWQFVVRRRRLAAAERAAADQSGSGRRASDRGALALALAAIAPLVAALLLFPPLSAFGRGAIVGLVAAGAVALPAVPLGSDSKSLRLPPR